MTLLVPRFLPSKQYPFSDLRHADGLSGVVEGVVGRNAAELLVVQRAAGANMTVDVASGSAWIEGDDTARQGKYHVVNDATANVGTFAAAHATLPRIDQVIIQNRDSSVTGSNDDAIFSILTGTATSGAQAADPTAANYRAGAAALPNSALRLADVLIPATSTSVTTANIVDRRPAAYGYTNQIGSTSNISIPAAEAFATGASALDMEIAAGQLLVVTVTGDLDMTGTTITAFIGAKLDANVASGGSLIAQARGGGLSGLKGTFSNRARSSGVSAGRHRLGMTIVGSGAGGTLNTGVTNMVVEVRNEP